MFTIIMIITSIMLILILSSINLALKEEKSYQVESSCNFECGFNSQAMKNNIISTQFMMIALLFIIFDVEIAILIPILKNNNLMDMSNWNFMLMMMVLILGTMMEWKSGMMEWTK